MGGRGEDVCTEWQPRRVGTLAGSMLPFISLDLTSDPAAATVTAYFGVSHSGRVRSRLQQSKPPRQRQCLPRPLRHPPALPPPPPRSWLPPPSPCPLSICPRPQPFPSLSCGELLLLIWEPGTLLQSQRPCLPRPLCTGLAACGLVPWVLPLPWVHLLPVTGASEPKGGSRGENGVPEPWFPGVMAQIP